MPLRRNRGRRRGELLLFEHALHLRSSGGRGVSACRCPLLLVLGQEGMLLLQVLDLLFNLSLLGGTLFIRQLLLQVVAMLASAPPGMRPILVGIPSRGPAAPRALAVRPIASGLPLCLSLVRGGATFSTVDHIAANGCTRRGGTEGSLSAGSGTVPSPVATLDSSSLSESLPSSPPAIS